MDSALKFEDMRRLEAVHHSMSQFQRKFACDEEYSIQQSLENS